MTDETIKLTQVILQAIHAVRTNTANFHESDWELRVNKHHFMLLQEECTVMATSKENYIFGINIVIDDRAVYPVLARKMPGPLVPVREEKPWAI